MILLPSSNRSFPLQRSFHSAKGHEAKADELTEFLDAPLDKLQPHPCLIAVLSTDFGFDTASSDIQLRFSTACQPSRLVVSFICCAAGCHLVGFCCHCLRFAGVGPFEMHVSTTLEPFAADADQHPVLHPNRSQLTQISILCPRNSQRR